MVRKSKKREKVKAALRAVFSSRETVGGAYHYIQDAELFNFVLDSGFEKVEVYICPCGKYDIVVYNDDD